MLLFVRGINGVWYVCQNFAVPKNDCLFCITTLKKIYNVLWNGEYFWKMYHSSFILQHLNLWTDYAGRPSLCLPRCWSMVRHGNKTAEISNIFFSFPHRKTRSDIAISSNTKHNPKYKRGLQRLTSHITITITVVITTAGYCLRLRVPF